MFRLNQRSQSEMLKYCAKEVFQRKNDQRNKVESKQHWSPSIPIVEDTEYYYVTDDIKFVLLNPSILICLHQRFRWMSLWNSQTKTFDRHFVSEVEQFFFEWIVTSMIFLPLQLYLYLCYTWNCVEISFPKNITKPNGVESSLVNWVYRQRRNKEKKTTSTIIKSGLVFIFGIYYILAEALDGSAISFLSHAERVYSFLFVSCSNTQNINLKIKKNQCHYNVNIPNKSRSSHQLNRFSHLLLRNTLLLLLLLIFFSCFHHVNVVFPVSLMIVYQKL